MHYGMCVTKQFIANGKYYRGLVNVNQSDSVDSDYGTRPPDLS